jgi:hypothetical protein
MAASRLRRAAMTSAFVIGPVAAIIAGTMGAMLGGRR